LASHTSNCFNTGAMIKTDKQKLLLLFTAMAALCFFGSGHLHAQKGFTTSPPSASLSSKEKNNYNSNSPFGNTKDFIENKGQYGAAIGRMGNIQFGYEGFDMPVLFTNKGLVQLNRERKGTGEEEREAMQRKGVSPEKIAALTKTEDRFINIEWLGANPNVKIIAEQATQSYHTYGTLQVNFKLCLLYFSILYPKPLVKKIYFTSNQSKPILFTAFICRFTPVFYL
jgi:hypothetical protein